MSYLRCLSVLIVVICVQSFMPRARTASSRPRARADVLKCSGTDSLIMSLMSSSLASSSVLLSEQKVYIDSYVTTGIPPVFLILSLGLVAGFAAVPVISRKRQVQRNSRSIDETELFDKALEEKLTNRETLNETYEEKGSVGRYTKD